MIRIPADDPLGVLKIGPAVLAAGAADGELAGTTFVAKDLYDVAGYPTGAGNPEWEATHPVPTTTASAVARLLAAGATLIGKSHTDELAYSLSGTNVHYGTPVNNAGAGVRAQEDRRRARRRRSRAGCATSRSEPTRAAPSACRRASAESSGCGRPTAASLRMESSRSRRPSTRWAGSPAAAAS